MIDLLVHGFFDDWIREKFKMQHAIRAYLLAHERKEVCIKEVIHQVRMAELSNIGKRLDMRRIKMLAEAGAEIFAKAAVQWAEERSISQAEKSRRVDEANRIDNLKAELIDNGDIIETDKVKK